MIMARLMGLCAIIPMTMLLTVSFFVQVVIRKIEVQGIKAFGYVVSGLLWISAALVFSLGIYVLSTGRPPMQCMMQKMMGAKKECMMEKRGLSTMEKQDKLMYEQGIEKER